MAYDFLSQLILFISQLDFKRNKQLGPKDELVALTLALTPQPLSPSFSWWARLHEKLHEACAHKSIDVPDLEALAPPGFGVRGLQPDMDIAPGDGVSLSAGATAAEKHGPSCFTVFVAAFLAEFGQPSGAELKELTTLRQWQHHDDEDP